MQKVKLKTMTKINLIWLYSMNMMFNWLHNSISNVKKTTKKLPLHAGPRQMHFRKHIVQESDWTSLGIFGAITVPPFFCLANRFIPTTKSLAI